MTQNFRELRVPNSTVQKVSLRRNNFKICFQVFQNSVLKYFQKTFYHTAGEFRNIGFRA